MFVIGRVRRMLPGHPREATANAIKAGAHVAQATGHEVAVYLAELSPTAGQVVWASMIEHLDEYDDMVSKLMVDDEYEQMLKEADQFYAGELEEFLLEVIDGDADAPSQNGPPNFLYTTEGSIAPGHTTAGLAASVEVGQIVRRHSGLPTLTQIRVSGTYSGVIWTVGAESLAALEAGRARANSAPDLLEAGDRLGAHFDPGTHSSLFRRLG